MNMRSDLEGKRRVAAFIFLELVPVYRDCRSGHRAFEVDKHALAFSGIGQAEMAAINRYEFIALIVEAVPGQHDVGVRKGDFFEARIVEAWLAGSWNVSATVQPVAVHRQDLPAGARQLRLDRHSRKPGYCRGQKITPVHSYPSVASTVVTESGGSSIAISAPRAVAGTFFGTIASGDSNV